MLFVVSSSMAGEIDVKQNFELKVHGKALLYKIWLLPLCINISLYKELFIGFNGNLKLGIVANFICHNEIFEFSPRNLAQLL